MSALIVTAYGLLEIEKNVQTFIDRISKLKVFL